MWLIIFVYHCIHLHVCCMVVLLSQSFRWSCCRWCIPPQDTVDKAIGVDSGEVVNVRIQSVADWWRLEASCSKQGGTKFINLHSRNMLKIMSLFHNW